jgi:peptidoglycan hydrolase CwlO-like protein
MEENNMEASRIDEKTLMPLGVILSILATLVGAVWWASAVYARVAQAENSIQSLQINNSDIAKELKQMNNVLIEISTQLKLDEKR